MGFDTYPDSKISIGKNQIRHLFFLLRMTFLYTCWKMCGKLVYNFGPTLPSPFYMLHPIGRAPSSGLSLSFFFDRWRHNFLSQSFSSYGNEAVFRWRLSTRGILDSNLALLYSAYIFGHRVLATLATRNPGVLDGNLAKMITIIIMVGPFIKRS